MAAGGKHISSQSENTHITHSLTHSSHTPAGSFESLIKFKLICFWTVGGNWNLPLGEKLTFTIGINFLLQPEFSCLGILDRHQAVKHFSVLLVLASGQGEVQEFQPPFTPNKLTTKYFSGQSTFPKCREPGKEARMEMLYIYF